MLIDIIFVILLFFACIKGLRKGFILGLFSAIGFIAGLAAALKLSAMVAARLSENAAVSGKWLPVISFLLVFLAVVLLVNLTGRLLEKTIEISMLGWLNKLAGIILYSILYSIVFSVFLFYVVQLRFIEKETIQASALYPFIQPIGPKVINALGVVIPFFKDIFAQLQDFFGAVANKIEH